ncbi:MAG: guanylate kinase [Rickettsiales bacterium]|jgi:guanylate kinase|nr:guanylate kinase [Rickettsiales bacterium]
MMGYDNFVIILSSPSGAGKSTITKRLLECDDKIKLSVSATTRNPREGEVDGIHYYFFNRENFEEKIKSNSFVEYAKVFDNYYGTLKSEIENKFNNGNDIILDIDWQGARQVSKQFDSKNLIKIFILPPSLAELENRLRTRGKDSEEVIQNRMSRAKDEISHFGEYDFVVVNDDIERVLDQVKALITAKRLTNVKQGALEKFIKNL